MSDGHGHHLQKELGQTGRFGEFFIGLGALIALGGIVIIVGGVFDAPLLGFTKTVPAVDGIQAGALFLIEGIGFILFGVLAIMSGWARHHPGWEGETEPVSRGEEIPLQGSDSKE